MHEFGILQASVLLAKSRILYDTLEVDTQYQPEIIKNEAVHINSVHCPSQRLQLRTGLSKMVRENEGDTQIRVDCFRRRHLYQELPDRRY